jgi:dienelactone hydrolase
MSTTSSPEITAEPANGMSSDPVAIQVTGLVPATSVVVEATMTDRLGATYRGVAEFEVGADGCVDLTRQAPRAGTYRGIDGMGLFWSVEQTSAATDLSQRHQLPDATWWTLRASVDGVEVARLEVERRHVSHDTLSTDVRENELVGRLYLPPGTDLPGMIVITGSGGGLALQSAASLAARGYAALALAYFGIEGRPDDLAETPLEYLEAGIAWLCAHPAVDPERVGVMGTSKGGELALLLGATCPQLRAVVAYVPSTLVYAWGREGERIKSSWTRDGKGLPCASVDSSRNVFREPPHSIRPGYAAALEDPEAIERAAIPIERTRGAILMISGEADAMWPSSDYAELGVRRLARHRFAYPYEHLRYADAGHHIGQPNLPTRPMPGQFFAYGGDPRATAHASRDSWPRVLAFLERALSAPQDRGSR